jgi:hypothetical protein
MENRNQDHRRLTDKLLKIITEQCVLLDNILAAQRHVRVVVRDKEWAALESALRDFDTLSDAFTAKEEEREEVLLSLGDAEVTERVREGMMAVRRRLTVSRIENAALNEYLKITQNFLEGVFDSVVENRAGKVYSRTGNMVHSRPERLVLDALL